MEAFISLGDQAPSACASEPQPQGHHGPVAPTPTPKDAIANDGIIHLHQNQVHMNAPPETQTQPQDNVNSTVNAAPCVLPVETRAAAEPSARLVYNNLTRESKRKLMELMQQWSQLCQARIRYQPNSSSTVEDMDPSDGSMVLVTKHGVSAELGKGSGPEAALVLASTTSSAFIDQSPTRGGKRGPTESTEPSVSVVCNNLTRESKRELMELMQQWSVWQATKQPNSTESTEQVLDCGEETYYPALHVGSERPCAVSFWVDNNQARENAAVDVDDGAVPLYDREFTLGSTPMAMGDSSNAESEKEDMKDDWRCLNCASSSHALKDCPKPHDHVAISIAREHVKLKRKVSKLIRQQNRPLKRRYL